MNDKHIIRFLEELPLALISASDLQRIEAHSAECDSCLQAYEASRAAAELLRNRASVAVAPSPFFQTRVMAAVKEQMRSADPFAFWKLWQAARSIVVSLAIVTASLTALTFYPAGHSSPDGFNQDPADLNIFDDDDDDDDISTGQMLMDIYDDDLETQNGKQ